MYSVIDIWTSNRRTNWRKGSTNQLWTVRIKHSINHHFSHLFPSTLDQLFFFPSHITSLLPVTLRVIWHKNSLTKHTERRWRVFLPLFVSVAPTQKLNERTHIFCRREHILDMKVVGRDGKKCMKGERRNYSPGLSDQNNIKSLPPKRTEEREEWRGWLLERDDEREPFPFSSSISISFSRFSNEWSEH